MKQIFDLTRKAVLVLLAAILTVGLVPAAAQADQSISVTIDGVKVEFPDQMPVIVDGRTLVPVAGVFNAIGFEPSWNDEAQTATLTHNDFVIVITIGSKVFTTNGEEFVLDVPAQIIEARTMLPLRAVLESIGICSNNIGWDDATRTITIITNNWTVTVPEEISYARVVIPAGDMAFFRMRSFNERTRRFEGNDVVGTITYVVKVERDGRGFYEFGAIAHGPASGSVVSDIPFGFLYSVDVRGVSNDGSWIDIHAPEGGEQRLGVITGVNDYGFFGILHPDSPVIQRLRAEGYLTKVGEPVAPPANMMRPAEIISERLGNGPESKRAYIERIVSRDNYFTFNGPVVGDRMQWGMASMSGSPVIDGGMLIGAHRAVWGDIYGNYGNIALFATRMLEVHEEVMESAFENFELILTGNANLPTSSAAQYRTYLENVMQFIDNAVLPNNRMSIFEELEYLNRIIEPCDPYCRDRQPVPVRRYVRN